MCEPWKEELNDIGCDWFWYSCPRQINAFLRIKSFECFVLSAIMGTNKGAISAELKTKDEEIEDLVEQIETENAQLKRDVEDIKLKYNSRLKDKDEEISGLIVDKTSLKSKNFTLQINHQAELRTKDEEIKDLVEQIEIENAQLKRDVENIKLKYNSVKQKIGLLFLLFGFVLFIYAINMVSSPTSSYDSHPSQLFLQ